MLVLGLVFLGIGGVLLYLVLPLGGGDAARQRAPATPPTAPISQVPTGYAAQVCGQAVASEQGLVRCPTSGREALLYRIDISILTGPSGPHSHGARSFLPIHTARERHDFYVDDGTGRARIFPAEAFMVVPVVEYGRAITGVVLGGPPVEQRPLTPQLEQWAESQTALSGTFKITEKLIAPGEPVLARGLAERDSSGGLFFRNHEPQHQLLLSTLGEPERTQGYAARAMTRKVIAAIGLAMLLLGIAAIVLDVAVA